MASRTLPESANNAPLTMAPVAPLSNHGGNNLVVAEPDDVIPPVPPPSFEMVVLGSGGGPLETDCSGYLVKPINNKWEDGILALEGGSGIGALKNLFALRGQECMFPDLDIPPAYNTPVLKAAYVFSFLSCYLISHAHLDHAIGLILLSGSVPTRPARPPVAGRLNSNDHAAPTPSRIPVYALKETLDNLAAAYGGGLWPELGEWAPEPEHGRKRRKLIEEKKAGVGAKFVPLFPARFYSQLHPSLPVSTMIFPLSHGATSHGPYGSSAVFVRYDATVIASMPASRRQSLDAPDESLVSATSAASFGSLGSLSADDSGESEFLFFGDFESAYRPPGAEDVDPQGAQAADQHNRAIWEQAARRMRAGRLSSVFMECSYDAGRSAELMYGHLSPQGVFHELSTLASLLPQRERPLAGLRVFITHIKEFLQPHPTGLTARELIGRELAQLEETHQLGVTFTLPVPGDRILV